MKTHHVTTVKAGAQIPRERQLTFLLAQAALRAGDIEDDVTDLVIDRVIDSVSVAIAALSTEPPARAHAAAKGHPRSGGATLIGLTPDVTVHAEWAAYANCTAVRHLDWSDAFGGRDLSHPSDVMGTMIAAAQQSGRTGRDAIRGIVHGYQAMLGLVAGFDLHHHGVDQMCNLGTAVPVGLAALLQVPIDVAYQAVQLSSFLSTITFQMRTGLISTWKGNAPGFVGKTAIEAMDRALRGEESPTPVYEGPFGTIAVLLDGADFTVEILEPGESPRYMTQSIPKQWSADYLAQPFMDLAFDIRSEIGDLTLIDSIVVTASEETHDVIGSTDPLKYDPDAPRGTIDHSLPYMLAVALQDGTWDFEKSFSNERIHQPSTRELWRKIRTQADPTWTKAYSSPDLTKRKFGGRVDITFADGTTNTYIKDNANAFIYPTPWGRADYIDKFMTVADRYLDDGESARFLTLVQRLPQLSNAELHDLYPIVKPGVIREGGRGLF
ncbi:2-methylcitrate dehydratase [Mycolicibacterium madagascariense]|uniref:2-methylcitrate dehydratase n=1 Tax=Mycolicibacterium madagascariense TaxID=212765 RepID=A0A7I7XE75_9MYCO|nr:MmgE/PrpD family protein [Mycolicibacterium madagascariense]MCV7015230.1 MmgE/PrpD family protein [Mycolicibacterium madagascariense]BBZ27523.1 2-methylcitrate dehydratase [Mycolicibacterium madagascariense]